MKTPPLYTDVHGKSMPGAKAGFASYSVEYKRFSHRWRRIGIGLQVLLVAVLVTVLAGCGVKTVDVQDPFMATANVPRGPVYLPDDDGRPLTIAERAAFSSTGDFDRRLTVDEQADVLRHFKNLVHENRRTVELTVSRANTYLPLVRSVMRENGLPAELAYLPFVESNYNPLALSRSGALGMWQFMPPTGRQYGLSQDGWVDERRDPVAATRSASRYLSRLYGEFEDWHLAVSAYNAGEGKIGRGLKAAGAKTFFELRQRDAYIQDPKLQMTEENKQYLPKFLAVCKIMRNLELLGFAPLRPSTDVMREVAVKPGTDLLAFSRALGMDWETFMQYNAGYLRYIAPPDRVTTAYVPAGAQSQAVAWLESAPRAGKEYAQCTPYTVSSNETLAGIARKKGVTVAELTKVNPNIASLRAGQVLLVPPAKRVEKPAAVAKAGGKSGSKADSKVLAAAKVSGKQGTVKNTTPRKTTVADKSQAPQKSAKGNATYQVQQGDTLWAIARKFNVPPHDLLAYNNMTVATQLQPGDVVKVLSR